jgi:F-type H+-transporting ATPase subunit b
MFEDATFWALVALVVFLAAMVYLKVPGMVTSALDKRAQTIQKELDEARRLREEAQALLADYQRKGREAEGEAEEIIEQAKREADALTAESARRLEEYVANRTRQAEEKIAQAEAQAIQEVRALSADVAIAAAEKLLTEKVKGATAEALIARTIDQVKSKLN